MATGRYSDYKFLDVAIDEHIATVTLSNPAKLNACDAEGHTELSSILRVLQGDDAVRSVVVTGSGRAFSVGGDLELVEQMHRSPRSALGIMKEAREIVQSHIDFEKPIVAAVNGVAMGAASGLRSALRLHRHRTGGPWSLTATFAPLSAPATAGR